MIRAFWRAGSVGRVLRGTDETGAVRRSIAGFLFFLIALVAYVLAAWRVLTAPEDWLLQIVPDDTFYYLQIARNLASLGRSTADGVTATNGYHPLWMAIATSLASFRDGSELLRGAVVTSFVLNVGAALMLRTVLARLTTVEWAWTAAACWLLNPLAFLMALQATEASMYAIALLMVLMLHLRLHAVSINKASSPPSSRFLVVYGASLGGLCLARTEGIVIAGLAIGWCTRIAFTHRKDARRALALVLVPVALAAIVMLPWFLFSLSQVGTIVQDSGVMKALWVADEYPGLAGKLRNLIDTADYLVGTTLRLMTTWNASKRLLLVICVLFAAVIGTVLVRRARPDHVRVLTTVLAPALTLGVIYGTLLGERQIWWLVVPCLTIFFISAISVFVCVDLVSRDRRLHMGVQAGLVFASLAIFIGAQREPYLPYPWQPAVKHTQAAFEKMVPSSERIGCFNAGIPMFFGAGRVIALDGLVNHEARVAWTQRRFEAFLAEKRVRFIADEQRAVNRAFRFSRVRPSLRERASYPLPGWATGRRVLWEVVPPVVQAAF